MPTLQVIPARHPSAPAQKSPLRVFLSYSHDDAEHAAAFVLYFQPLIKNLGVELFYDSARLKAGDDWESTLLHELRRSQVFVFLVSAYSLDGYCMETELAEAAAAGLRIVPVVLTECMWERQPIPCDPAARTLGALNAVPVHRSSVLPVTHWRKRDQGWTAVMKSLQSILEEEQAATPPSGSGRSPGAPGATVDLGLLPYLCGQHPIIATLDRRLRAWGDTALVVLVRGQYDDNPERFWERLRLEHLSHCVAAGKPARGPNLAPDQPLLLPVEGHGSPEDVRGAILSEFSRMLTQNAFSIDSVPALTRQLRQHARQVAGTISILAIPDARSAPALRNALESLLALLDNIDDPVVLRRMVISVHLERADLPERLAAAWELQRFSRSCVVELEPLVPVDDHDAHTWYLNRRVRDQLGIDEARVKKLFQRTRALRLRKFATSLERILNPE